MCGRAVSIRHSFRPARRSAALRETWHVSDRRPALLYVGRVSREKGLLHLPAISDRLHERGLEHRCIIVGDGPLLPALRQALPDAVFTGSLSRAAVAEAFASADCFVFPSSTDTAGNVVLEAQASGLPVIVSGSGGPRENMVAGCTGAVCHRDDPQDWADAIAGVVAQPMRAKLALSARQYALTRTWERALDPLYRAYATSTCRGDRGGVGGDHRGESCLTHCPLSNACLRCQGHGRAISLVSCDAPLLRDLR